MRRAELWTIATGSGYTGKPRPVIIVQSDAFDGTASVTVCPITSDSIDAPLARVMMEPSEENGLRQTSYVMVDKVTTAPRDKLRHRIGQASKPDMLRIDRYLVVFLGIAD
ncbi:type II toxin-antitoxin system PemK/MazF family toxin [Nocardia anaemiae]|uniref:type II toxin-antitoxin system PemK/MazF family toxin n=1 Tax=Nocardia anaemiae TaxID=263910 RepID=UPI0007A41E0A|nr:type II toxin-antitoxin system PemK/MazF family toxin [Nocardia anaemiae]